MEDVRKQKAEKQKIKAERDKAISEGAGTRNAMEAENRGNATVAEVPSDCGGLVSAKEELEQARKEQRLTSYELSLSQRHSCCPTSTNAWLRPKPRLQAAQA